jgi:tetratricopeptide (TPR) repeat protein
MGGPAVAGISALARRHHLRGLRQLASVSAASALVLLSGCATQGPAPPLSTRPSTAPPSGSAQPAVPPPAATAPAERPATQPPKAFHLGAAATALLAQAERQAGSGDYTTASATLERAVRIEPDNPLVWIELGRMHLSEGNAGQADALGRKALSLATGDAAAQASAWRLIADSLRARGRNADAYDADRRAASLAPH